MPGGNCAFPQCTVTCYAPLHKGISLFKIPTRKTEFYSKWRNDIVDVIKRYRVIDSHFLAQVNAGKRYVCERHFLPKDIERTSKFFFNLLYFR